MNSGGPAFPQPNHVIDTERGREQARDWMQDTGMSLRAYLVGQAIAGGFMFGQVPAEIAKDCCELADALIAELNKETQPCNT